MATNNNTWYKDAVFYELNLRSFYDSNGDGIGDLPGLIDKFEYFIELGIDCIWLMPIYPSPLKDDGYDIADYLSIHPDLGTIEDFKLLLETAHGFGIKIITDLVVNHTSDQHAWFQAARRDPDSEYRDYYIWSDTDQRNLDARIIFLDVESSNWAWDEKAGQYYWHRFYSSQPDLNFENPAVQAEMLKTMEFWLELGIDGFRVDAVPYLFEEDGTDCENLPETHRFLKEMRRLVDEKYPNAVLLCEANQWPKELRAYFGDGDEFHMGFHFPLMPRIFMALESGEVTKIKEILALTPEIPENCQWCTFLRNHDELTLEMVTEEERHWMWERYAPEPRMRQNLGIRRRLAPLLDNNMQKIGLANSLLFTLPGSPIVYYGDEIGMGDNVWLEDRNGVRTPMQWSDELNGGFSTADPDDLYLPVVDSKEFPLELVNVAQQRREEDSLFHLMSRMIRVRKASYALSRGEFAWADTGGNERIAAYFRTHDQQRMLVVNNLSADPQKIKFDVDAEGGSAREIINGLEYPLEDGHLSLDLQPHEYLWLVLH